MPVSYNQSSTTLFVHLLGAFLWVLAPFRSLPKTKWHHPYKLTISTSLLNIDIIYLCGVSKYYGQSIAHIPLCFPPIMWDWPEENVKLAKEIVSPSLPFAPFILIGWYLGTVCSYNLPFHSMSRMFQMAHNMPSDMLHTLNTHNKSKTCITWMWNVIRYLSI
jgi:hypothetical protein